MIPYIEAYLWYKKILKMITITLLKYKLTPKQIALTQVILEKKTIINWYQDNKKFQIIDGSTSTRRRISNEALLNGIMSKVNLSLTTQKINTKTKNAIIAELYPTLDSLIEKTNKEEGRIGIIPEDIE